MRVPTDGHRFTDTLKLTDSIGAIAVGQLISDYWISQLEIEKDENS